MAIVIVIATAITQVKYLNDALSLFSNSEVIPVHYTLFTLLSMTGSTILYQVLSRPPPQALTRFPPSLHTLMVACLERYPPLRRCDSPLVLRPQAPHDHGPATPPLVLRPQAPHDHDPVSRAPPSSCALTPARTCGLHTPIGV